jgi:stress-induced morphogen
MSVEETITAKLNAAFSPLKLIVENDSARHAGHHHGPGKADQGGASHFNVTIVSEKFAGVSRLQRHRLVNEALTEELAGPVHALAVRASAPDEA